MLAIILVTAYASIWLILRVTRSTRHDKHHMCPISIVIDAGEARSRLTYSTLPQRAGPNGRLVTAFGIQNAFTTTDVKEYKNFLARVKPKIHMTDFDWQRASASAISYLDLLKPKDTTSTIPLESMVQTFVFQMVIRQLFPDTGPISEPDIKFVTTSINTLWIGSKSCTFQEQPKFISLKLELLSKLAEILDISPVDPSGDMKNPLNLILPAYETLWRVVLRCFLEVRFRPSSRSSHSQEILKKFAHITVKANFEARSLFEPYISVKDIVNEALRLYPPTRRVYRQDGEVVYKIDVENMQRSEEKWGSDAMVFDPRRWLDGCDKKYLERVFMPFGKGKFTCPAENTFGPVMIGLLVGVLVEGFGEGYKLVNEHGIAAEIGIGPLKNGRESCGCFGLRKM